MRFLVINCLFRDFQIKEINLQFLLVKFQDLSCSAKTYVKHECVTTKRSRLIQYTFFTRSTSPQLSNRPSYYATGSSVTFGFAIMAICCSLIRPSADDYTQQSQRYCIHLHLKICIVYKQWMSPTVKFCFQTDLYFT